MVVNIDDELKKILSKKISDIIMKIPEEVIKFEIYSRDDSFQLTWKEAPKKETSDLK